MSELKNKFMSNTPTAEIVLKGTRNKLGDTPFIVVDLINKTFFKSSLSATSYSIKGKVVIEVKSIQATEAELIYESFSNSKEKSA